MQHMPQAAKLRQQGPCRAHSMELHISFQKKAASQAYVGVQVAKEQLLLEGELTPFHTVVLRLPVTDETHIAPALDKVAEALGNQVSIGSYPVSPSLCWSSGLYCF